MDITQNDIIKTLRSSSAYSEPDNNFTLFLKKKIMNEFPRKRFIFNSKLNIKYILPVMVVIVISVIIGGFLLYNNKLNSKVVKPDLLANPISGKLNLASSINTDGSAQDYLNKVGGQFLTPDQAVPGSFTITFKQDSKDFEISNYLNSIKAKIINKIDVLKIYEIQLDDKTNNISLATQPSIVDSIETERTVIATQISTQSNSSDKTQSSDSDWDINFINSKQAVNELGKRQHLVKIAVIDTGACFNHPFLKDKYLDGYNILNSNEKPLDENGHGCAVAGILTKVSPYIRIFPIKAIGNNLQGKTGDITFAIYKAQQLGADIINISAGNTTYSKSQDAVIKYVTSKGITIVASAGNDSSILNNYPASYNKVINVGSLDQSGNKSWFNNKSGRINTFAPGSKIYTTTLDGGYGYFSGTSFAAPHIAALISLQEVLCKQSADNQVTNIWNNCNLNTPISGPINSSITSASGNIILNTAPIFTSTISKTDYITGDNLSYIVTAKDAENDQFNMKVLDAPQGVSFINNTITWNNPPEGSFNFKLSVSDGDLASEQSFTINVHKPAPVVTIAPPSNPTSNPRHVVSPPIVTTPSPTISSPAAGTFINAQSEYNDWTKANPGYVCAATILEIVSKKGNLQIWFCGVISGGYTLAIQENMSTNTGFPIKFMRGTDASIFIDWEHKITNSNGYIDGFKDLIDVMVQKGYP